MEINALRTRFNHAPFNRVGWASVQKMLTPLPIPFRSYFLPASQNKSPSSSAAFCRVRNSFGQEVKADSAKPRIESNAILGNPCIRLQRVQEPEKTDGRGLGMEEYHARAREGGDFPPWKWLQEPSSYWRLLAAKYLKFPLILRVW